MTSAPGKTILMGEHAVVHGAPALVSAVGLRARASVEPAGDVPPGRIELVLPDLDHRETLTREAVMEHARRARERWEEYCRRPDRESVARVGGGRRGHVVLVALGEAEREVRRRRGDTTADDPGTGEGLRLRVRSEIPVGRGFGSSAAVGAAVAGAWLVRRGEDPSREEMDDLLLEIERRQHGDPSGVDAAAVLRGGLVWAEPTGEGLAFDEVDDAGGVLDGFRLADTGEPAEDTGEVVAAVRESLDRGDPGVSEALDRIGRATAAFRRLLSRTHSTPDGVIRLIRRCQRGLEEIGVVPAPVRRLVRAVENRGGAAKISGAGALTSQAEGPPGGGLLLIYHPDPGSVGDWSFPEGVQLLDVPLGAKGLRREDVE